ncbi:MULTISPECIES: hypothetical protein [Halorubrum]|uniref:Uncharacterized protein n=1 Tax=Halorubrum hochstenium ATCC 700873 TaxID=1227481 RepID=M0FJD4_9EURY|nr:MULTISPECIES: hypothetical protein [Halorubrum]ELZ59392.1 hypothetical protein C467_03921 [Halorubrum hochstenium ATCC 700873]
MKRRQLVLLLGGGSAAAASAGTGAFSSVSADREVSVNVVEDEKAYLGIEGHPDDEGGLQIKNQFAGALSLDLTATVVGPDGEYEAEVETERDDGEIEIEVEIESDDGGGSGFERVDIGLGQRAVVNVDFEGSESVDLELSFSGTVADGGATVDKTRKYTVSGGDDEDGEGAVGGSSEVASDVTMVKFFGSGDKVRILTTENSGGGGGTTGVVDAKLYCEVNDSVTSNDEFESVHVNTDLYPDAFDESLTGDIVGVEIAEFDGVFVAPENGGGRVEPSETETEPFWN